MYKGCFYEDGSDTWSDDEFKYAKPYTSSIAPEDEDEDEDEDENSDASSEEDGPPNAPSTNQHAANNNAGDLQLNPEPQIVSHTKYLDRLATKTDIQELEAGVTLGLQLLDSLKTPLQAVVRETHETQAAKWLKDIEKLKGAAKPSQTIVGVVGNTGEGKSSLINALLDEEKLVPTNGMRACTASVTEISYNYSDDPSELYQAEIEFITAADWVRELRTLLNDLLDDNGNFARDCTTDDTDAAVAYSKIRAVYPDKTRDMIAESVPERLANEPAVRNVLGSIKKLKERTCAALFRGVQRYVDSKEVRARTGNAMEFWPLIKVVRIYCKSACLSTGIVIVDLPGVQDSNAARAAVAENYMKKCTGLWITAAITRAVNNKTAKDLLGKSFKRQLKYDGQYNAVTFICTKADDISETETVNTLGLESEVEGIWEQLDILKVQMTELGNEISDLQAKQRDIDFAIDELDNKTEMWEDLMTKLDDGETVYRPSDSKKRKRQSRASDSDNTKSTRTSESSVQRKRRSLSISDSGSDHEVKSDAGMSDEENDQSEQEDRPPLTKEDIEKEIAEFKARKKDSRQSKKELNTKITGLKKQKSEFAAQEKILNAKITSICIKARNTYSRNGIKRDFALGVKELDQEAAAEEDEENFDPEKDLRNYDAVAKGLPVFCISSNAYHKLSGRLKKDNVHAAGFNDLEDTEIPQLQAHAKKLSETGRARGSLHFLNELNLLLNSMQMWASNNGTVAVNKKQQRIDEMFLRTRVKQLQSSLDQTVKTSIESIKQALNDELNSAFNRLIPLASSCATSTATGWGAHRSLGGLAWATYKAVCRRSGSYTNRNGPIDFNAALFDPIQKQLTNPWQKAFQGSLPSTLATLVRNCKPFVEVFHLEAVAGVSDAINKASGVNMLNQQLRTRLTALSEQTNTLQAIVTEKQRDASRGFIPSIQNSMEQAYTICTNERGPGSYLRMKSAMINHVDEERHNMFQDAADQVMKQLDSMCEAVKEAMDDFVDQFVEKMRHDYLTVFVGEAASGREAVISVAELELRDNMHKLLLEADSIFAPLFPPKEDEFGGEASDGEPGKDEPIGEAQNDGPPKDESIDEASNGGLDAEGPVDEASKDQPGEEGHVGKALKVEPGEEGPIGEALKDRSGEEGPVDEALEDRSGEEARVDEAMNDQSGEEAPVGEPLEDQSGKEASVGEDLEDQAGQEATIGEVSQGEAAMLSAACSDALMSESDGTLEDFISQQLAGSRTTSPMGGIEMEIDQLASL